MYKNWYKDEEEFNKEINRRKKIGVLGKVFRLVTFPLALFIAIVYKSYKFAWETINEII